MKKTLYLLISSLLLTGILSAQTFLMDDNLINTCSGSLYDSGGPDGSYQPGEITYALICSGSGEHARLTFFETDMTPGDTLRFFDGLNASAPEILPSAPTHSGRPFAIQATAANASGCLFVSFRASESSAGMGWRADITCTPACQTIMSGLETVPAMNGRFIDICPGDSISFKAMPAFPQNGISYEQSTQTVQYFWSLGDGYTQKTQNFGRTFDAPGGYRVRLDILDDQGCENSNYLDVLVRVSPGPALSLAPDNTFCEGDTLTLYTSLNAPSGLPGITMSSSYILDEPTLSIIEPLFLPDGTGLSYERSLQFSDFPMGLTFGELEAFEGFFVELEHSYAGDLDIEIICPTGQSAYILQYPSAMGSTNFGEPFATAPVDAANTDPTQGIPYLYNFLDGAPGGSITSYASNNAPSYTYTTVPSEITGQTYTYTDRYLPPGSYGPATSFSALNGCPMNGEWAIRITDNLGLDNGWLFSWGITDIDEFASSPSTVSAQSWLWDFEGTILYQDPDSALLQLSAPGEHLAWFQVYDNFSCLSDTSILLSVLSPDNPFCALVTSSSEARPGDWRLFPNPAADLLNIVAPAGAGAWSYRVHDATGQTVHAGQGATTKALDTAQWPTGIYFIKIESATGSTHMYRVAVRQR